MDDLEITYEEARQQIAGRTFLTRIDRIVFRLSYLYLIWLAKIISKRAWSHRGFKVGCAALVRMKYVPIWWIVTGINTKPWKGKTPKVCAEQHALQNAQKILGIGYVVATVVYAKKQPDGHTNIMKDTTPMCHVCRIWAAGMPIVGGDMIVVTVSNGTGHREEDPFLKVFDEYEHPDVVRHCCS